jgi:hypothetical protein
MLVFAIPLIVESLAMAEPLSILVPLLIALSAVVVSSLLVVSPLEAVVSPLAVVSWAHRSGPFSSAPTAASATAAQGSLSRHASLACLRKHLSCQTIVHYSLISRIPTEEDEQQQFNNSVSTAVVY